MTFNRHRSALGIALVVVVTLGLSACDSGAPPALTGPRLHLHANLPQNVVVTTGEPWEVIDASETIRVLRMDDVLTVTPVGDGQLWFKVGDGTVVLDVDTAATKRNANDPDERCNATLCAARGESLAGTPMLAFTQPRPIVDVTAYARVRSKATDAEYPLVFPFFALELLGETLQSDTADLNPNLDAVNALAYERHHIQDGQFIIRSPITSDPKTYADDNGLPAWPMLTHDRPITPADIASLYNARSTIISDAVATAVARGYVGYVLDVEVSFTDIVTPRTQYLAFVEELVAALHAADKKLMVATARWINLAPIDALAATDVDYIASMDPMHPGGLNMWLQKIPTTYADVGDPARLIWVFSWDFFRDDAGRQEQLDQLQWMEDNGYNDGVAGASCFRTPMATPNSFHSIDYYAAFRSHYPAADAAASATGVVRGIVWDKDITPLAGDAAAAGALLPNASVDCGACDVVISVDATASWQANLPAGTYTLTASTPEHVPFSRVVTVTPGTTVWASLGLERDDTTGGDGGPGPSEPDGGPSDVSDGGEPDGVVPDGGQPETAEPEGGQPDAVTPESGEPDEVEPDDDALPPSVQPQCTCVSPSSPMPWAAIFLFGLVVLRSRKPTRRQAMANRD